MSYSGIHNTVLNLDLLPTDDTFTYKTNANAWMLFTVHVMNIVE